MRGPSVVRVSLVVVLLLVSGYGVLVGTAHPTAAVASAPALAPSPPAAAPAGHVRSTFAAPLQGKLGAVSEAGGVAQRAASAALAAAKAAGVKTRDIFVPRASATAAQVSRAHAAGHVAPLYDNSPAPMGVAYYGLSAAPNGSIVASTLNTSSVRGSVDATSQGIWGGDLFQSSPDSYGIQLNAVTTNVTLFGHGGYSFWTQDVMEFFPAAGLMVLVTNVWNFSGQNLSANVFYGHGPFGHQVGTTFYYAEAVFPIPISYPWNLTLTMTSNTNGGRDAVEFNVSLVGPSVPSVFANSSEFDYVIFNSTPASHPFKVVAASNYTADGSHYDAFGLTNDFELILGGPGGGSHVDLTSVDATFGLSYWDGSAYVPVPAGLNYGGETGETASGVSLGWSNAPGGGPANVSTYAVASTGPSLLQGLWNASTAAGVEPVTLNVTPSNAFVVLRPADDSSNFSVATPVAAALAVGDTLHLSPGNYSANVELSGYTNQTVDIEVDASAVVVNVTLVANPSRGLYTPLWALSNAQLAAISSRGSGTPSSPYVLFGGSSSALGSEFGLYNDFTFPVWPGVFLRGTTASVEITNEPMFTASTSLAQFPGANLPATNSLQFWFWNASNVVLANTTFANGWFGGSTFGPISFDTFNAIFFASDHDLVYNDTFATPSQGLVLFQGGALAFGPNVTGPSSGGGGNNTVYGSTFYETSPAFVCPDGCDPLFPYSFGLGLQIAEANDTVFNNYVATPTTAWELPLNMYTGSAQLFQNSFNITPGTHHAALANFPGYSFAGPNILGGPNQGGNFWWDYGSTLNPYNGASNPVGQLPYIENGTTLMPQLFGCVPYYCASYIYPGGDRAPLTDGLLPVKFHAVGLPKYAPFGVLVALNSSTLPAFTASQGVAGTADPTLLLASGSYRVQSAFVGSSMGSTTLRVSGPTNVTIRFTTSPSYGYLFFREAGLPSGTPWGSLVVVGGIPEVTVSTFPVIGWLLPRGSYPVGATGVPNYYPVLTVSTVLLKASASVVVHFKLQYYFVTFNETGLGAGAVWSVTATGSVAGHTKRFVGRSAGPVITLRIPNGTFSYAVKPIRGFTLGLTGSGTVVVAGGASPVAVTFTPVTYAVTFTETGLAASTFWYVSIGGQTLNTTGTTLVFQLTNGTYSFTVGGVPGHTATARPAMVRVIGAPVPVAVTWT